MGRLIVILVIIIAIASLLYFFLPGQVTRIVSAPLRNLFGSSSTAKQSSPSPSATAVVQINASPNATVSLAPTRTPSATPTTSARATATPRATGTAIASASASTTVAQDNKLPGTGDESRDGQALALQVFASCIAFLVGLKLRKHI